MLTTKSLIITTDSVSLIPTNLTDPFKTQTSCPDNDDPMVQEYGSSDVTSDQSTDLSPVFSEEEEEIELNSTPTTNSATTNINNTTRTTSTTTMGDDHSNSNNSSMGDKEHEIMQNDISPIQLFSSSASNHHTSLPSSSHFVPIILERHIQDRISVSMLDTYEKLLPTRDAYERRRKFITKVEAILNSEWEGHDIRAHLFGSSANDLGTSTSDVDICLTTSWTGLKCVRTLATVLKKHGMQRVYTVPRAKVPIVKMWDPVYQLACDMNVNNPLALHNTHMIKTYVAIDPRVRPLAMVIKHWTQQRALNNAADGGTLSTYTWTCMIINFLQMREPPILPVLHQMNGDKHNNTMDSYHTATNERDKLVMIDGLDTSFYTDVNSLRDFGKRNHESLAGLLFAFFRRFAYEFDYETQVVSVRHGRYLSKQEKGWHEGPNKRMFCIEEPFNVHRNLGNSADDASVYGLQTEFRRAVHIMLETESLETLCTKYVFPSSQTFPATTIPSSSSPFLLPLTSTSLAAVGIPQFHPSRAMTSSASTAMMTMSNHNNMATVAQPGQTSTITSSCSKKGPTMITKTEMMNNSNGNSINLPPIMPMTRALSSTSSAGHSSSSGNSSGGMSSSNTSNSSSNNSSTLPSPAHIPSSAQLIPIYHHHIPSTSESLSSNDTNAAAINTPTIHHYMYHPHILQPIPPPLSSSSIVNNKNHISNTTTTDTPNYHSHYQHQHQHHYPYYIQHHSNNINSSSSNNNNNTSHVYTQKQQQSRTDKGQRQQQPQNKVRKSSTPPNISQNQHQQQQYKKQGSGDRRRSTESLQNQNKQQQLRQQQQQQYRKNNSNKPKNKNKENDCCHSKPAVSNQPFKRQQHYPQPRVPQQQHQLQQNRSRLQQQHQQQGVGSNNNNSGGGVRNSLWNYNNNNSISNDGNNKSNNHYLKGKQRLSQQQQLPFNPMHNLSNANPVYIQQHQHHYSYP